VSYLSPKAVLAETKKAIYIIYKIYILIYYHIATLFSNNIFDICKKTSATCIMEQNYQRAMD